MTVVDHRTGEIVEFDRGAAERRAERITLRLDAIAENYRMVLPMIREAIEKRDDIALGYRSPGDYVSDRFGQSLAGLGVEVRRAVVGELTEAGLSTRAIAPVVGVSNKTVHDDQRRVTPVTPQSPQVAAGAPAGADGRAESRFESETAPAAEPQGEEKDDPVGPDSNSRPAVTGIDGKSYSRPAPKPRRDPESVDADVAEFPDLAYYAHSGRAADVPNMAGDLRRFRERGELEERLDILRRSIAVDKAKRDGTYRPGTTAVPDDSGGYRMGPLPERASPITRTCPTCSGRGVIEE
jgi:hypothetical protein